MTFSTQLASKRWIKPVQAAFAGSLMLSLIAILTNPVINRDGILYLETARVFMQEGLAAAFHTFNWPFFSILIALISQITGISHELTAHLLNAVFMAGTCALLVSSTQSITPRMAWATCIAILALPGLNIFRDELLREYGAWFFITLSFWLALRWSAAPRWRTGILIQLVLCIAFLFRPEALAFFAALILWQCVSVSAPWKEKLRRIAMIGGIPFAVFIVVLILAAFGQFNPDGRLGNIIDYFNPERKLALFDAKSRALASALMDYAKNQASTILLMGSLSIIPLKFIKQLGLFAILAFIFIQRCGLRAALALNPLFSWAFLAHLFVLSFFVVDMQFLASRYVATLSLFAAPVIGAAVHLCFEKIPRFTPLIVFLALIMMLGNAISSGPGKGHLVDAGKWLAENTQPQQRVYIDSSRVAYYAGWPLDRVRSRYARKPVEPSIRQGDFDLVVIEYSPKEIDIDSWLESNNLVLVRQFGSRQSGSAVLVASIKHDQTTKEIRSEH